jgi:hypothetical protein
MRAAPPPTSCPARAPWAGDPCGREGLICEYDRAGWEPGCSELYACGKGAWREYADPDEDSCQIEKATPGRECAARYDAVPRGQSCSSAATCDYPEGRCACTVACAPAKAHPSSGVWACDDPAPDCPRPRPNIGSVCTPEGQRCSYEMCCVGAELECRNGAWWALLVNVGCEDEEAEQKGRR